MELSRRLAAIAEMVEEGSRLADVGTDHGYLPIWLVKTEKIPCAVAMDIGEGPLSRARDHVKAFGLEDRIRLRLSDGFEALQPGEAEAAVIAGMGGPLMIRILEDGREKIRDFRYLVLSPQSEIADVRRYLLSHDYAITEENMVLDEGKYYTVMKAKRGAAGQEPWSYIEEQYGKLLLSSGSGTVIACLEKEQDSLRQVRDQLLLAGSEKARERLRQVEEELQNAERAYQTALASAEMRENRQKDGERKPDGKTDGWKDRREQEGETQDENMQDQNMQ